VRELARRMGMSRALLHMHLTKLEDAGFVTGHLELSDDGKAMKFFEILPFSLTLAAYLIRLVAVAGGFTYATLSMYWRRKSDFAKSSGTDDLRAALDANTAASATVLTRLEANETRIGTVEKTLTDVPA
jgi:DNA-binding transcriptional ArsR family regulator